MSLLKFGFKLKPTLILINFMDDFPSILKKEQLILSILKTTGMLLNGMLKKLL